MSSYHFELENYHAVASASIDIDGITVLAGLNGSGKSTVARWLHHTVKVLNDYDTLVERQHISQLRKLAVKWQRALNSLDTGYKKDSSYINIMEEFDFESEAPLADSFVPFSQMLQDVSDCLMETLDDNPANLSTMNRYFETFRVNPEDTTGVTDYISQVMRNMREDYSEIINGALKKKSERTKEEFAKKLFEVADREIEELSVSLAFSEDDQPLMTEESFGIPLNLRNVVYLDTMNLGRIFERKNYQDSFELDDILINGLGEPSEKANVIIRLIFDIIGGDVKVEKSLAGFFSKGGNTYTFVSNGGDSFNLKGAATGIISFSIILQLLKNGRINENSMLIIDEPECHLHPQWIFEYARILVLINKYLGTKILISSHNPDMVSAIQTIADKEGVLDIVNFYLSEADNDNQGRFSFKSLGTDIAEIFDSFNVAIDRINNYKK